jgi:hypothetical protein
MTQITTSEAVKPLSLSLGICCCFFGPSRRIRYVGGEPFDSSHATFRFNALLRQRCAVKGCRVADPTDELFDFQTGQVRDFFWSQPNEMHCNVRPFFFWHRALLNAVPEKLHWCNSSISSSSSSSSSSRGSGSSSNRSNRSPSANHTAGALKTNEVTAAVITESGIPKGAEL